MCGIFAIAGTNWETDNLSGILEVQHHRGPDASGMYTSNDKLVSLGHNRLKIIDLSDSANQPFSDTSGRYRIVFNGEIYNYIELRKELTLYYEFRTQSDTEVLLAAYMIWGAACLDRLIGMFAFVVWDDTEKTLFAARDRFGIKPLYYSIDSDTIILSSEIKALRLIGFGMAPDEITWASYFRFGTYGHCDRTFFQGIRSLQPGCSIIWSKGRIKINKWYDLAKRISNSFDNRPEQEVMLEYEALLNESIMLRFRSDVPVGINLSGGLDSSILLRLVDLLKGSESNIHVFTFATGDPRYDELPWVKLMLKHTNHQHHVCTITASDIPELAFSVQEYQDEPFGGIPTLAYSKIFEKARNLGTLVLLDGQGLDEQWAGYSYYSDIVNTVGSQYADAKEIRIQGSASSPVRTDCMISEFKFLAAPLEQQLPFSDVLRNAQYKDTCFTKMPKALRFNDRVSMMHSTELRVPFLDHRLFELAFHQPTHRKIRNGTHKWLLRRLSEYLLPSSVVEAPKRPVQTPQREWLRSDLTTWVKETIAIALDIYGGKWLDSTLVQRELNSFINYGSDNSFYIWQWVNLGLWTQVKGMKP